MNAIDIRTGRPCRLALTLVLLALAAVPAAAQEGASIFTLLDTGGRSVAPGAAVEGALTEADYLALGLRVQAWSLEGQAGQKLRIDMVAGDDLDAYLIALGPGLDDVADDDGGDGTDARLCLELPESGAYRLVAASLEGRTGPFRLTVTADPGEEACAEYGAPGFGAGEPVMEETVLAAGAVVSGTLDPAEDERHPADNSLVDVYALTAEAGETLVVDLVSDQFDAFLYVVRPGEGDPLIDDDSGGRCNARVELAAAEADTYWVLVNAVSETGEGEYTVRVSNEPGPLAEGECAGPPTAAMTIPPELVDAVQGVEPGAGRDLPVGAEVTGSLDNDDVALPDGSLAQGWSLEGRTGEPLVVELLSEDFDAFLYVTGPGLDSALVDDDGAGGTDARLRFTPAEDGTYRVVVSTYGGGATGSFRLRALRQLDE